VETEAIRKPGMAGGWSSSIGRVACGDRQMVLHLAREQQPSAAAVLNLVAIVRLVGGESGGDIFVGDTAVLPSTLSESVM
jgi:hypothetical protein